MCPFISIFAVLIEVITTLNDKKIHSGNIYDVGCDAGKCTDKPRGRV